MLENTANTGRGAFDHLFGGADVTPAPPPIRYVPVESDNESRTEPKKRYDLSITRGGVEHRIDRFLRDNFARIYPDFALLEASVAMFQHKREGDQLRFIFNNATLNSYDKLTAGSKHNGFYMPDAEGRIIRKHLDLFNQLANEGRKDGELLTLFDLGTGTPDATANKINPTIKSIGANRYVGVDDSIGSAALSCFTVNQAHPDVELYMQRGDFNRMDFNHDRAGNVWEGRRLIAEFGGTMGNMAGPRNGPPPEAAVVAALKNIRRHLSDGEYFILGLDHNQDPISMRAAYTGELHDELGRGLLERIRDDLPHEGFDPDNFRIVTGVNPKNGLVYKGFQAKEAGSFVLGKTTITHAKDEIFVYNNSWKYTRDFTEGCIQQSGFKTRHYLADDKFPVVVRVLQAA